MQLRSCTQCRGREQGPISLEGSTHDPFDSVT